jgi:glycosyltransferase involved in cell wall biosynthesis
MNATASVASLQQTSKAISAPSAAAPLRIALIASSLKLAGAEKQFVYFAHALFNFGVGAKVFYMSNGDYYEAVLRAMGISSEQIYSPNRPLRRLARLINAVRKFRPQIVVASQFHDLRYAALVGRFCRAMIVGGVRSDGFYELHESGLHRYWMLPLCHGLVANSSRARKNLLSRGINSPSIEVLSNVLDLQDFDARAELPSDYLLPKHRVVAITVGRLNRYKRYDRFLDALSLARRREPALFGAIVGADQGAKAALEAQAKFLSLTPEHLVFLPESERIPALLSQAHLLVLCSDFEGFPNVILEAMAARLPVISTDAGDAALIVQEQKTGFVVPGDEIATLAERLVRLAQSAELRRKMGEAGRQRVEDEFQCVGLAPRLLSILQKFARRHQKPSWTELLENTLYA